MRWEIVIWCLNFVIGKFLFYNFGSNLILEELKYQIKKYSGGVSVVIG